MRFYTALCGGVTAVSALTLPFPTPERIFQAAAEAPALPLSAFPKFETVKLQDAQQEAAADTGDSSPGQTKIASAHVPGSDSGTRPANIHSDPTPAADSNKVPDAAVPPPAAAAAAPPADAGGNTNSDDNNTTVNAQTNHGGSLRQPHRDPPRATFPPATSRYEDFVRLHQAWTPNIHNNDLFLIWHRYFVWAFEQALRNECGFNEAGLPWWDETRDAGRFAASPVFTAEYFGSLPKGNGTAGTCITDGRFAGTTLHIGPGTGSEPHCLSRAVDEKMTAEVTKEYEDICLSRSTFTDFARCWEQGLSSPHGIGHNSIGSVMADVRSSPDRDTTGARRRTIDGCADGARPCAPLTLQSRVAMGGLLKDVSVGQVLDTTNGAMCYQYGS
ncbi:Di-copper centre-containing protein [Apiospora kogelbergensis]|uniref:Di-copper centre-containing protein n=1 Tax=Apiospora kogelbergensis TaxID=1337665 RepID=UPI003131CE2C